MKHLVFVSLTIISFNLGLGGLSSVAWGQQEEAIPGQNVSFEFSGQLGNVLPNQVPGVTEITPQWGVRTGFRTSKKGFVEVGGTAGKGSGVSWSDLSLSLRMDIPVETIMGFTYLGGDLISYEAPSHGARKFFGGGHVGGGVMSLVGDAIWFRADMKFNINPGTSLFIGAGFMLRFGGGSGSGESGS